MVAIAILGATGHNGRALLAHLLERDNVTRVVAINRREVKDAHDEDPRLERHVVENMVENLEAAATPLLEGVDAAFMCCGVGDPVTVKFQELKVADLEIPLAFARAAKAAGVRNFTFISGLWANSKSPYLVLNRLESKAGIDAWQHIKGELEDGVATLGFESVNVYRPSTVTNNPNTPVAMQWIQPMILDWVVPWAYCSITVENLAVSMTKAAFKSLANKGPSSMLYEGRPIFDVLAEPYADPDSASGTVSSEPSSAE